MKLIIPLEIRLPRMNSANTNAPSTVNLIISSLFIAMLCFACAAWHLAEQGKDYAPFLAGATGALGALSGLLANTHTDAKSNGDEPPTPVKIQQGGGPPVPVHEVKQP